MSFHHLCGARRLVAVGTFLSGSCRRREYSITGRGGPARDAEDATGRVQHAVRGELPVPGPRGRARPPSSTTKVFVDAAGVPRVILGSGALTGTLTHVLPDGSDGPSMRVNFSGPGKIDPATGVASSSGPWLIESRDDAEHPAFEGFLLLVRGRATISPDPVTGSPVVVVTAARSPISARL